MMDPVADLLKQARVIVDERGALTSNKLRQALNLIAKGPRINKDAVGGTKFKAAMVLRNLCLIYRGVPMDRQALVLTMIGQSAELLAGLSDDPGAIERYWMRE